MTTNKTNLGAVAGTSDITYPEDIVLLDYVFPNQTRYILQSKTRVVDFEPKSASECPLEMVVMYNTPEAVEPRPELILKPVALFNDPFRGGKHKIVLAEVWDTMEKPSIINTRQSCLRVMEQIKDEEPWFGIEQEFLITDQSGIPIGYKPEHGDSYADYHSSVGINATAGMERDLTERHFRACSYTGIKMYGNIREDAVSQWEYQVGPCEGISMGDQLHVSRYILLRIAEMLGVEISLEPKPIKFVDSVGSGGHINFSTKRMRGDNGILHIKSAIDKMSKSNQETVHSMYDPNFGKDIKARLNSSHYSPGHYFTSAIGDKENCSVRIPTLVSVYGKGYFEDRRPTSHCDPYAATEVLVRSCVLGNV